MKQTSKPNILLIVADDLGRADVGFMGSTEIKTPNLDALAKRGAILNEFYTQPVCTPSRAALLTGRYPTSTGVYTIIRPNKTWGLPTEERTLPAALKDAGYETAIIGKWHLGEADPKYRPMQRGFDYQYGNLFGALDYYTHKRNNKLDWFENEQPSSDTGYTTDLLAQKVCDYIQGRDGSKPFFMYLAFNAVHGPFQTPPAGSVPATTLTGDRGTYAQMVASMDNAIGKVMKTLKDKGMSENTLVIFLSDNGGPYPDTITRNAPLRAGKGTIYEGGVRVCAFATWWGKIPFGQKLNGPCHAVDWYPTLLKLAGAPEQQALPVDGKNLWPMLTQKKPSPHEAIPLCGLSTKVVGIRKGEWKLLINPSDHDAEEGGETEEESGAKPPRRGPQSKLELYNLTADPKEEKNLAAKRPGKASELRQYLENTWMKNASKPASKKV